MHLPGVEHVNDRRITRFMERIDAALEGDDLQPFRDLVARYESERGLPAIDIAAALARLAHGDKPLLLTESLVERAPREAGADDRGAARQAQRRQARHGSASAPNARTSPSPARRPTAWRSATCTASSRATSSAPSPTRPGLDSQYIGRLTIRDDHSLIDLPPEMPKEILAHLKKVRVAGRMLRMQRAGRARRRARQAAAGRRRPGPGRRASRAGKRPQRPGKAWQEAEAGPRASFRSL